MAKGKNPDQQQTGTNLEDEFNRQLAEHVDRKILDVASEKILEAWNERKQVTTIKKS